MRPKYDLIYWKITHIIRSLLQYFCCCTGIREISAAGFFSLLVVGDNQWDCFAGTQLFFIGVFYLHRNVFILQLFITRLTYLYVYYFFPISYSFTIFVQNKYLSALDVYTVFYSRLFLTSVLTLIFVSVDTFAISLSVMANH